MRIIYELKHRYAISLKLGYKFLTSLTKLETKASTCSTIKENLLRYSRKVLTFVVVVIR